ncbi:MAG: shikimate kinase [Thermodesulfobacteriota bacterium]
MTQKHKNIFLVGFMGAGKSTVGKIVASKLDYGFIDADTYIEDKAGKTITQIFADHGEDHFRNLESEATKELSERDNLIIASGGGVVQRNSNWDAMKSNGLTIYLRAKVESVWKRIKDDNSRPLLQVDDPIKTASELLEKRTPMYEKADLIIDTDDLSPAEVAQTIISKIE